MIKQIDYPILDPEVKAIFASYPPQIRQRLMSLRQLIYNIAHKTEGVGKLEETLKWRSPSYLTTKPKSGTTLRIDGRGSQANKLFLCVHCQTTLISEFKSIYGDNFLYDGNRCLILDVNDNIEAEAISWFIKSALTYHLRRKTITL